VSYPLTAVISDLHGNLPALGRALADARGRGVERYVCLGDVVGYGASPLECLDEVMQHCTPRARDAGLEPGCCLLGNHEQALLSGPEDFNERARTAIEWTRDRLQDGDDRERSHAYWDFLGSLEPTRVDGIAYYVHGAPRDPVHEYLLPRDALDQRKMGAQFDSFRAAAPEARVCFVGHSHVPGLFHEDGRYFRPRDTEGPCDLLAVEGERVICNVGSVGQPRDGDPRLSYAVFDGRQLTFVRLEYDLPAAQAAIRAVEELPESLADRLERGR